MNTWNLAISSTLDRAPGEQEGMPLGRAIAGDDLVVVSTHENRFSVTATAEADDGLAELQRLRDRYAAELAARGFAVTAWESAECLSLAETDRRITTSSIPPMVSATEFAELCGVAKQRIYELETERKKAAERGKPHRFPTPVVPGYWLRSAAEHYARNRPRRAGRPRKDEG
ncbi:hypothetical protein [Prauserella endophytica]|uniref:DNA-binding protein n=1 Tax=Prauserella endophytica TaxID=1592324 RepID=A0ABY2RS60_9PSEU|nr:hypothetical protein [Prauserella endophytica]TKG57949.1 hypothetical protein FCN18_38545 [Prauserella endophytica]